MPPEICAVYGLARIIKYMKPAIEIKQLKVVIEGQTILDDITVDLPAGHIIGLLGPSGAGKTTLIRVLVGLQSITSGEFKVFGLPVGSAKLRSQIGYMPQAAAIYPDLTLGQNLTYFAKMSGQPTSKVGEILGQVDLTNQAHQLASTLSGGQASRASLAVALLTNPKLLVLDEPTVGVDPVLRHQLWALFSKLARSGTTLIVTSHIMDEANRCEQLLLIRYGRILANGSPKALIELTKTSNIEEAFLSLVEHAS